MLTDLQTFGYNCHWNYEHFQAQLGSYTQKCEIHKQSCKNIIIYSFKNCSFTQMCKEIIMEYIVNLTNHESKVPLTLKSVKIKNVLKIKSIVNVVKTKCINCSKTA